MEERNLQAELERLNIISFDSSGIATKNDVLAAIDAIDKHIMYNSDESIQARIVELRKAKAARRFKAGN